MQDLGQGMGARRKAADAAPERMVAGSGVSQVWNAFSDGAGRFHVGHWTSEPGVRRVAYDETEFCVILEGRVRLEGKGGAAEFGPGEAFAALSAFLAWWFGKTGVDWIRREDG